MRRWLFILLLAILPLQFTWAAVASYCQHEQTPAKSAHLGHHEHQHHDASENMADSATKQSPLSVDEDCAYCHLGCAQFIPIQLSEPPAGSSTPQVSVLTLLHDSYISARLERPDIRIA